MESRYHTPQSDTKTVSKVNSGSSSISAFYNHHHYNNNTIMPIPSRQIGWSEKTNLLWEISKKLERLTQLFSTRSLVQDETTLNPIYAIGDSALGGKIAYILEPGDAGYDAEKQHGLVAFVISGTATWGCYGTVITGANGFVLGTGNQNTIDIISGCSTVGIAAKLCSDLIEGGYSDWYLPSYGALDKLYLGRAIVGIYTDITYWSSTQFDSSYAWFKDFQNGYNSYYYKNVAYSVIAVRNF
jgi:hypothetical protein